MRDDVVPMLALRRLAAVLALLALVWLLLFHGLARYGVVNGDEAFRYVVAATMLDTGDYFRLDFRGEQRLYDTFMTAPVLYRAEAFVIGVLGEGRLAMRLLSALFGLASVMLTGALARRLAGDRAGLLAAAVQLTTFQFVYWHSARTGEAETATAFFFTAVAWSFLRFAQTGRGAVVHHVCWLLLANTKLPLALLPLLAELAAFAALPSMRPRFRVWLRTAVLVLPLGLVWHFGQLVANWEGFVAVASEMFSQASGTALDAPVYAPLANATFYFFAVLYGAFPYSLLYPCALASLLWTADREDRERWLVLGLFVAAVFAFFLLVAKHYRWYWTPALPLLSVFVGVWLDRSARRGPSVSLVVALGLLAAGLALIDVDIAGMNPFSARTPMLPLVLPLRSLMPMPIALQALLVALAAAGLAVALGRALGERAGAMLVGILVAVSFATAVARMAGPLQYLDHRTEMARVREEIDRARAAGEPLSLPIALREGGDLKVRALFANDFEIVAGEGDTGFWLIQERDPPSAGVRVD